MDGLFLAYASHGMFADLVHSLGRAVMWSGVSQVVRSLPVAGAVLLVLAVLAVAWLAGRRR